MSLVPVLAEADLPAGSLTAVQVDGVDVALARTDDGELYAVHDECTHAQVKLSEGEVVGHAVECWVHCAQFDLRTGAALTLPATTPLDVYRVEVVDGTVHVDVHHTPEPVKEH